MRKLILLFALVCSSASAQSPVNFTEVPLPSDSLVDSIGVNVHMTYSDTAYGNTAAVTSMLSSLGVRHVRDGAKYYPTSPGYNQYEYAAYQQVSALGIGFDLILDFSNGTDPNPMTPSVLSAIQGLATSNSVIVDFYEGPNEVENSGDPNWAADTRSFMQSVWSSAKATPGASAIPILGNTLSGPPSDWVLLGNMTAYETYGNMHPYANTQYPSYQFAPDLANEINVSGSQTIYITEAGWSNAMNATDNSPNVTEDVSSRYMGRLFLETLLHGWPRTYAYELVDEQADPSLASTQEHFGLFRNDYSPKPAATVITNMITLMSDKGYAVELTPLSYSLATASPNVHHLLFRNHDGSYWLAIWQEVSDWSGWNAQGTAIANPDVGVTVTLPGVASSIQTYRPHDSTAVLQNITSQQAVTLMVPDHPLLVRISFAAVLQPPTGLQGTVH